MYEIWKFNRWLPPRVNIINDIALLILPGILLQPCLTITCNMWIVYGVLLVWYAFSAFLIPVNKPVSLILWKNIHCHNSALNKRDNLDICNIFWSWYANIPSLNLVNWFRFLIYCPHLFPTCLANYLSGTPRFFLSALIHDKWSCIMLYWNC